jgi:7-cyano-7-deazaguanine reductase
MNKNTKKKLAALKPVFNQVTPSCLEVMPYQYSGKHIDITIETEEFSCLCPWSGLPDFAYLTIQYSPDKVVVELKSLKFYLQSYRMVGMVHESVVNHILEDLVAVVKPAAMTVNLVFNTRGGITTTVNAEYRKK